MYQIVVENSTFLRNLGLSSGAIYLELSSLNPMPNPFPRDISLHGVEFQENESVVGAALYIESAASLHSLFVGNCTFVANRVTFGGLVYDKVTPVVSIVGSVFRDNFSGDQAACLQLDCIKNRQILILESTFTNNSAKKGTVVSSEMTDLCSLAVVASTFEGNSAKANGGVIFLTGDGLFSADRVHAIGNTAGLNGAFLSSSKSVQVNITNCHFEKNQCYGNANGGAVAMFDEIHLTVDKSIFFRNVAASGGAFYIVATVLTHFQVDASSFTANVAAFGSGGAMSILLQGSSGQVFMISESYFSDNSAKSTGGAIHAQGLLFPSVFFSEFVSNTALSGGAISLVGVPVTDFNSYFLPFEATAPKTVSLSNLNFQENTASSYGGGFFLNNIDQLQLFVSHCNFSDNFGLYGGGFAADCNVGVSSSTVVISTTLFSSNKANGGAVFFTNHCPQMNFSFDSWSTSNAYNNSALFGSAVSGASPPRQLSVSRTFSHVFLGQSFKLVACVEDSLGNIVKGLIISSFRLNVQVNPSLQNAHLFQLVGDNQLAVNPDSGCAVLENLQIVVAGFPDLADAISSCFFQNISLSQKDFFLTVELLGLSSTEIEITVAECPGGFGVVNKLEEIACLECPPEQVKLVSGCSPCTFCPPLSACSSNWINVQKGYWLIPVSPLSVLEEVTYETVACFGLFCSGNLTCSGNRNPESLMCGSCLAGFSRWGFGACVVCPGFNFFALVGYLLMLWCYVLFVHLTSQSEQGSAAIRLVLYFFQGLSLILNVTLREMLPPVRIFAQGDLDVSLCPFPTNSYFKFYVPLITFLLQFCCLFSIRSLHSFLVSKFLSKTTNVKNSSRLESFKTWLKETWSDRYFVYKRSAGTIFLIKGYSIFESFLRFSSCVKVGSLTVVVFSPDIECSFSGGSVYLTNFCLLGIISGILVFTVLYFIFKLVKEWKSVSSQKELDNFAKSNPSLFLSYTLQFSSTVSSKSVNTRSNFLDSSKMISGNWLLPIGAETPNPYCISHWWEFVILLRRVTLVVCLVLLTALSQSEKAKVVTVAIISIGSMLVHLRIQPFKNPIDNNIDFLALFSTVLIGFFQKPNGFELYLSFILVLAIILFMVFLVIQPYWKQVNSSLKKIKHRKKNKKKTKKYPLTNNTSLTKPMIEPTT